MLFRIAFNGVAKETIFARQLQKTLEDTHKISNLRTFTNRIGTAAFRFSLATNQCKAADETIKSVLADAGLGDIQYEMLAESSVLKGEDIEREREQKANENGMTLSQYIG